MECPMQCILRGGLFYGPGTGRETVWLTAARRGRLRLPGDGGAFLSLIHVSDMAQAVVAASRDFPSHSTYNVVDDQPVSYRELFSYIAALVGGPPPEAGGEPILPSLACSNALIRSETGWVPCFPSYRSGLAQSQEAPA